VTRKILFTVSTETVDIKISGWITKLEAIKNAIHLRFFHVCRKFEFSITSYVNNVIFSHNGAGTYTGNWRVIRRDAPGGVGSEVCSPRVPCSSPRLASATVSHIFPSWHHIIRDSRVRLNQDNLEAVLDESRGSLPVNAAAGRCRDIATLRCLLQLNFVNTDSDNTDSRFTQTNFLAPPEVLGFIYSHW